MNTPIAARFMARLGQPICLLAAACLFGACAAKQTPEQLQLAPGTRWQEVVKVAGASTGKFSYVMNGRKYDLVGFKKLESPLVFEDLRLFATVSEDGMYEWNHCLTEALKSGELPFENGLGPIHSWVMEQRRLSQSRQGKPAAADPSKPVSDIAQGMAGAVILAPISPFILAGGLVEGGVYAVSGSDRQRAQQVNDALVGADGSYAAFLSQFAKPGFETSKGTYRVSEYYATQDSFLNSRDYFYDVGTRKGKVLWVAYQSYEIRQKTAVSILAHLAE